MIGHPPKEAQAAMTHAFLVSTEDQPHAARAKAILQAHPEVRALFGRNPWTALVMVLLVGLQVAIAYAMGRAGPEYWWLALLTAYVVGAFATHALYVIIHEATHNLIFANRLLNRLCALTSDLPNVIPGAIGFGVCHLRHHAHQGDYERDADLPSEWEARLIGNRWYAKAVWLLLFPFFQLTRPSRLKSISVFNRWTILNIAVTCAFDYVVVVWFGWNALIYLFASLVFALGLHPLGARWIQEHYTVSPHQETFSYYGPLNRLALNVGFHNEHHDFPAIPWNRLPKLREQAREFYDGLTSQPSWPGLLIRFIFDSRYSLHSRVLRGNTSAFSKV
jgi:sphingolipid delta-4 desaturase